MTEISTIIAVSVFAFLGTNMDNFALLTALFAKYRGNRMSVLAGHLLAVGVTLFAAGLIGEAANVVSVEYLGYLGVIPIAMGVFWIYRSFAAGAGTDATETTHRGGVAIVATFLSLLSNSTDTLLAQAVVFADTAARLDWVVAVSAFSTAIMLAVAAYYGIRNPRFGPAIERYSIRIAPLIMIAIGLYVLANTATDVLQ